MIDQDMMNIFFFCLSGWLVTLEYLGACTYQGTRWAQRLNYIFGMNAIAMFVFILLLTVLL